MISEKGASAPFYFPLYNTKMQRFAKENDWKEAITLETSSGTQQYYGYEIPDAHRIVGLIYLLYSLNIVKDFRQDVYNIHI